MKGVTNYLKNITKSVVYAAADVSKNELMPNIGEFTSTNKDFLNAAYKTFKNPTAAIKGGINAVTKSKIYEAVDYGARNLIEDLRTGNFYNKEREDRDSGRLAGMNVDDWGDLSEFDIDDNWEDNIGKDTGKSSEVTAGDMKIVESIEGSNSALANATVNAVMVSADAGIKNARVNTGILYDQNERLFGRLNNGVSALNSTAEAIFKLTSASLQNMDNNMSSFFTESLKLDTERNAILKEMLEMQRNTYKSAAQKEEEARNLAKKKGRLRWSDVNTGGMIDLESYAEAVKYNIKNNIGSKFGISGFSEDSNMLAAFMTSPLKGLTTELVKSVIPAGIQLGMKELDKSITGIFGNIIGRLGNERGKNDGSLLGMIANILGINTSVNRRIDSSKYEKGAVPFDGLTRKAIIDVIPTYLRRIDAAISGREEQMFDFKTGKWTTANDVKKQYDNIKQNAINQATQEIYNEMKKGLDLQKAALADDRDRREFDKAIKEFRTFLYDTNGQLNEKKSASANGVDYKYAAFKKYFEPIMQVYKDLGYDNKKGRVTKYSTKLSIAGNVLSAKDNEERMYRDIETDPTSIIAQLMTGIKTNTHGKFATNKDGSQGKFTANNNLLVTKDNLGHNIFDYLQEITKELKFARSMGGFGNGKPMPAGNAARSNIDLGFNINNDFFKGNTEAINREFKQEQEKKQAALKKIEETVTKGKGVDFRQFDTDQKAYLASLSKLLREKSTKEYDDELKVITSKDAISKFLEDVVYKSRSDTGVTNDLEAVDAALKDLDKKTNKKDEEEKETGALKGIFDKIKQGRDFLGNIVGAPAEAFTNLLYTADRAIYDMMFRAEMKDENKGEYNGFIDMIGKKITKKFDETFKILEENVINPFKKRLGIDDNFKDRFKNTLSDMGSRVGSAFIDANRSVWGPGYEYIKRQFGLSSGETALQTKRRKDRKKHASNIDIMNKATNLVDDNFIKLMTDNGLNYVDYNDIESAKKDLAPLLYKQLVSSTNGMKEYSGLGDLDLVVDYILKYSKDPVKELQNFAKNNNIKLSGGDLKELTSDFKNKMFKDAKGKSKQSRMYEIATQNGIKDSESLEDIKNRLRGFNVFDQEKGIVNYKFDEPYLAKLTSREDAIKAFLREKGFSGFAMGTPNGIPVNGLSMLSKNETVFDENGVHLVKKSGLYNLENAQVLNSVDSDILRGRKPTSNIERDLRNETNLKNKILNNATGTIAVNAPGTLNIKNADISMDEIKENTKKYLPEGLAGGLAGGIISTLFGIVGGPLIGAAVGSAGSIIASSDTLKNKLFGEAGEDGNRKGGIIPKTVMDTVKRYVPDMAKYGLAGIIPGLLTPLGPIGGLLVGSTIGILKNNRTFTEKYFGENGSLKLDDKTTNVIRKFLPNTAKGAAVGVIAGTIFGGPFGILGNAAIGSAIGMMTSTDEFKDSILGTSINGVRSGGFIGYLKEIANPLAKAFIDIKDTLVKTVDKNIVNPLARFVTPAIHALPQLAAIIPRMINNKLEKTFGNTFEGFMKDLVIKPLTKVTSKIIKPIVTKPIEWATKPFRLIGAAGDAIRKRQINTRNAGYMTAEERNTFRAENNMQVDNFDLALSQIGKQGGLSLTDAINLRNNITSIVDDTNSVTKAKKKTENAINNRLNEFNIDGLSLNKKAKKQVRNALLVGDIKTAQNILATSRLSGSNRTLTEKEINDLLNGEDENGNSLSKEMTKYIDLNNRFKTAKNITQDQKNQSMNEFVDVLDKLGVDTSKLTKNGVLNKHELMKYVDQLQTEITRVEANGPDKEMAIETAQNENLTELVSISYEIKELLRAIATGNTDSLKKYADNVNKAKESSMEDLNKMYKDRKDIAKKAVDAAGGDSSNLTEDELNSMTSTNVGVITGISKGNAIVNSINNGSLDTNNIGAVENTDNIKRLDFFNNINLKLDSSAVSLVTRMSETTFKTAKKIFGNKNVQSLCRGRFLTDADIQFASSITSGEKQFFTRCKILVAAGKTYKDFNSLEEISKIDGNTLAILKANNRFDDIRKDTQDITEQQVVNGENVQVNGLGTFLLGGIRKGISKVGSLLSGRKKENSVDPSSLASGFLGTAGANTNKQLPQTNNNEIDNTKQTQDVQDPNTGEFYKVERKSDGSLEPATGDAQTKKVMNLISIKNKAQEKLQTAQLKACELINKTYDTTKEAGSKGGKFSWLQMILFGTVLYKSGLLGKLFNGIIKPIWTDHLKPFITDKALPWITGTALPAVGEFITKGAGAVVSGLIKELPEALKVIIPTAADIASAILDSITGNSKNVGAKTTTNFEGKNDDELSNLTDENGNQLTVGQVKSGKYKNIYNEQGAKAIINEDGSLTFEDESKAGSSFLSRIGAPTRESLIKGIVGGGTPKLLGLANKASSKLIQKGGLLGKSAGIIGKLATEPLNFANDVGKAINAKFKGVAANKAASEMAEQLAGTTAAGLVDDLVEEGVKEAPKYTSAAAKLLEKAKGLINTLFSNSTVAGKLSKAAQLMGQTNVGAWMKTFKDKVVNIVKAALDKGTEKVEKSFLGSAMKTIGKFITPIMAAWDFAKGCDQAEAMLGIKETSILEEIACGLSNAICNFLIVPSVVPGAGWIAQQICNVLGDDLAERQKAADEAVQKYNEENHTTYSTEEYLQMNNSFTGKVASKIKGGVSWAKDKITSAANWVGDKFKSFFSGSGTSGKGTNARYGRGYVKQIDPSVSGIRFNSKNDTEFQTIGNSGCGPAAAVNAVKSIFGRGGNELAYAADFAIRNGYKETNGGTRPEFFTDYFSQNGLGSQISYNKSQLENNINNGQPTVLMGKDNSGVNSSNPFGKTPHYVTVTGTDGRGNAIVQDPESNYDDQLYSIDSLMNKTTLGVSAFGMGKSMVRHVRTLFGKGSSLGNVESWINCAKNTGATIVNNGFVYSNSGCSKTLSSAVKSNKKSNCALFVSFALQEFGALKKGQTFYSDANGNIKCSGETMNRLKEVATIISVGGKHPSKVDNLQVGDICCYHSHTNIYAGRNKNGKMVWLDQGKGSTEGHKDGSKFKTYTRTGNQDYYTMERIIRLKYGSQTTVTASNGTTAINQDNTSGETTGDGSTSTGTSWADLINNTKAGQALSLLLTGSTNNNISTESTTTDSTTSTGNASGDGTNKGNTWAFFKNNGFSDAATAGIMGNLEQESGTNPSSIQGNGKGPAAGIAQWENYNTKSNRWKLLSDYAKSKGKPWTDLNTQLEFLLGELEGTKGDSYTAYLMKKRGGIDALKKSTDYKSATDLFEQVFERAGKPMMDKRYKYAKAALDKYAGAGSGKYGRGGNTTFPTYKLTDKQLKGVANIVQHEQGGKAGRLAEASLIANRTDISGANKTPEDIVKTVTSGWFAHGKDRFYNPGNPEQSAIDAVRSVIIEGKRTLPRYVDEHDCFSDIGSVTNNGSSIGIKDRSAYKQHVSTVKNHMGSTYTFYSFPDSTSDPFGYTSKDKRKKWGDVHYDGNSMVGSMGDGNTSTNDNSGNANNTVNSFISMLSSTMTGSNVGKSLALLSNVSSGNNNEQSESDNTSSSSGGVGGSAAKVISVANGEIGYHEKASNSNLDDKTANSGSGNYTKYGKWYGMNGVPWCAEFVSWAANQAGVPSDVIPKYASTIEGYKWFKDKNQTIPTNQGKAGDIIFFTKGGVGGIYHTGIVEDVSNGQVHTIEGNSSDVVKKRSYDINNSKLLLTRPKYSVNSDYKADASSFANVSGVSDVANTRGGNKNKPMSRFGLFKDSINGKQRYGTGVKKVALKDSLGKVDYAEYDPDIDKNSKVTTKYGGGSTRNTTTKQKNNTIDYSALIKVIIETLATIADNTDKLNTIVSILNNKLGVNITQNDVTNVNKESLKSKLKNAILNNGKSSSVTNYQDTVNNSSLAAIINTMNALASE